MEQLKEKVEVQINDGLSESSTTDETSCNTSRVQEISEIIASGVTAEELIALNRKADEKKIVDAKVRLMHKRWEGKLDSVYTGGDQILVDDKTLNEKSELVQKEAQEEEERIRKSIEQSLALLRRTYEALGRFDDHMLQVMKREEQRLLDEARAKFGYQKPLQSRGRLPRPAWDPNTARGPNSARGRSLRTQRK